MIFELVFKPVFLLLGGLIDILPIHTVNSDFDISGIVTLLKTGFIFFPFDLFKFCIANIIFWLEAQMVWAVIEWIYKKIPGVN